MKAYTIVKIDNPEDIEASVYLRSYTHNDNLTGWGAVVDRQGETTEFTGTYRGNNNQVMLLLGAIEAIKSLPNALPIQVICPSDYITKWTVGRLGQLHAERYLDARKRLRKNSVLLRDLYELNTRRLYVRTAGLASGAAGEAFLERARQLAFRACGASPDDRPRYPKVRKPIISKPSRRRLPSCLIGRAVTAETGLPWD